MNGREELARSAQLTVNVSVAAVDLVVVAVAAADDDVGQVYTPNRQIGVFEMQRQPQNSKQVRRPPAVGLRLPATYLDRRRLARARQNLTAARRRRRRARRHHPPYRALKRCKTNTRNERACRNGGWNCDDSAHTHRCRGPSRSCLTPRFRSSAKRSSRGATKAITVRGQNNSQTLVPKPPVAHHHRRR